MDRNLHEIDCSHFVPHRDMTPKIYIIQRRGIYDQGIFGTTLDLEGAVDDAVMCITNEPDDYHYFVVLEAVLGQCGSKVDEKVAQITRNNGDIDVVWEPKFRPIDNNG